MTSSIAKRCWQLVVPSVLIACTPAPSVMTSGNTTTTYGGTNGDSAADGATSDATSDPGEVTDDGDPSTDTGPSDTDEPGPLDLGPPPDMGPSEGAPDGSACTTDAECISNNCWLMPFFGGFCGQCNEDADCDGGGCTPPNPFDELGPYCNMGELGGGCESDSVCVDGLSCGNALDLMGLIQINSCGECLSDADCNGQICAPLVVLEEFTGYNACIEPSSLPFNAYCSLNGNGIEACASGICSVVDIMGLAEIGACGECIVDDDCSDGTSCWPGEFYPAMGWMHGSECAV